MTMMTDDDDKRVCSSTWEPTFQGTAM